MVQLGFETMNEPIPLLMTFPHLDGLGAILDLPKRKAPFTKIGTYNAPLHVYGREHLGIRLDDWQGTEGPAEIVALA